MSDFQESELVANGHAVNTSSLHDKLHLWWAYNGRSFPWRDTSIPFHILLAEMMLRRTRAKQVIRVYDSFTRRYPDPDSLAAADSEEVADLLYPLGLSWRVPAFQELARTLINHHNGVVPDDYEVLIKLPGIGDYVASSICCFAFGQSVAIIDTNTVRVIGRVFGIPTHSESRRRRPMRELLEKSLDRELPASYNYALLDLAAQVCTPKAPACGHCPLLDQCRTGQARMTSHSGYQV